MAFLSLPFSSRKRKKNVILVSILVPQESELLKTAYGHVFDQTVVNDDIEETIKILEAVMNEIHGKPQWIPSAWVY